MTPISGRNTELEVDALQEEINQTRAAFAQTMQELAVRADVRSRARAQWARRSQRVRGSLQAARHSPAVWLVLAGAGAAVVAALLVTRGRRR